MLTGSRVGSYVGHVETVRLEPGRYRVTGPRGSVLITRAQEPVRHVSWACNRGRARKRTVWNIEFETVPEGGWWHDISQSWDFTLAGAVDRAIPAVCFYRNL